MRKKVIDEEKLIEVKTMFFNEHLTIAEISNKIKVERSVVSSYINVMLKQRYYGSQAFRTSQEHLQRSEKDTTSSH